MTRASSWRASGLLLTFLAGFGLSVSAMADNSATGTGINLETIMQNPDWMGNQPEAAWWSWNSDTVYYTAKHSGNDIRDTFRVPRAGGDAARVEGKALADVAGRQPVRNADGSAWTFVRNGDVFLRDLKSGTLRQITRTDATEAGARFLTDGRVAWRVDNNWYAENPATGTVSQLADLELSDDPGAKPQDFDYLRNQQYDLFQSLRDRRADRDAAAERDHQERAADATRAAAPFYLGSKVKLQWTSLSPSGRYLLAVTTPADYDGGKHDMMPDYVTESGYVEPREVRTLVGRNAPAPQSVLIIDLKTHETRPLKLSELPGIDDDPLDDLRDSALDWYVKRGADEDKVEAALKAPEQRPVTVENIVWSDDGAEVGVQLRAIDNKDRWIASIDFDSGEPVTQNRLTDPAWINWNFNEYGWLPHSHTLWYVSEESGYAQLYVKPVDDDAEQLTDGKFEVSSPAPSRDGQYLYFVANQQHPGWYDIYRVPTAGGKMERITDVGIEPNSRVSGSEPPFSLAPDGSAVLFHHGTTTRPPELYVQALAPKAKPARLSHTISEKYLALPWTAPKIIGVPSSHVDRKIWSRLYLPPDYDPHKSYPAVVFVHGAGYLQNDHYGWSVYFHEFMFHSLLTRHGYVVLDMDYRASEGYGRDWRTAIYRNMGHPELEDLEDGVHYLEKNEHVDPSRVGIYGGSYGGFMTYMAMFRDPEMFAAGAALRPVADWMHYNHGYTSNILNTPLVDPAAYERSSPIYFADQYANRPLLICQGVEDDNVFYKDTVRMRLKLLELHKENYEVAFFPLDHHGFTHADSWLDEYRRIFKLFENNLK